MRKIQFVNEEWYHIYNRGVDKRLVFSEREDYLKFLRGLEDLNNKSNYEERAGMVRRGGFKELSSFLNEQEKIVEIICYCLNPNHFHLVLKQLVDRGITMMLHRLSTSYTNYFNDKYQRSGSLFQGPFKAVHVDTDQYLFWLSGYVNGNPEIHHIAKANNYEWSSYKDFLTLKSNNQILGNKDIILSQFGNSSRNYENFINRVIEESRTRKDMDKYLLEKLEA